MIKAAMIADSGKKILLIGLSHGNLDQLRTNGLKGCIKVEGDAIGWPGYEIIITAGETEVLIAESLSEFIGPDTKINISQRLKS